MLFTLSETKFCIFIFQGCICVRRQEVKKILYDKYVPMVTIKDDHVDNHYTDKFVHLCHVDYFINGDGQKITTGYIYHTFYTFED